MGKRRNKKQGNRKNTENKAIEEQRSIEKKRNYMEDADEQTEISYVEDADVQIEARYAEETDGQAETPYVEEAIGGMTESFPEDEQDQNVEAAYIDASDSVEEQELVDVPIDNLLYGGDGEDPEEGVSIDRQHQEMSNDFSDFTKDFFRQIGKWIKRNRHMVLVSLAVCAGVAVVIWIVAAVSGSIDEARLAASVSGNIQTGLTGNGNNTIMIPVPQEALQKNAYPAVNELVARYFDARQANDIEVLRTTKNYVDDMEIAKVNAFYEYVESYDNITCYTKTGPIESSYIVYVSYDVKMRYWDVILPSLLTLFVCTNEDGSLYIYVGDFDENIWNYIVAITSQEDVLDLAQMVQTTYKETMDANPDFSTYMSTINDIIRREMAEHLADANYLDNNLENITGSDVGENIAVTGNGAGGETDTGDFEVQAITTVNVRASDSEVADRLGKVEAGTVLVCQEHQINGWSRIIYEGNVGYIKTEYLHTVGEGVDESAANGTITVSETVNVRKTADIGGEQIGVAYAGESFPLIGGTDEEWSKIIYNGQVGFVKSEFVLER